MALHTPAGQANIAGDQADRHEIPGQMISQGAALAIPAQTGLGVDIFRNHFPCLGVGDVLGFPPQARNANVAAVFSDRVGDLRQPLVQSYVLGHIFLLHAFFSNDAYPYCTAAL